MAVRECLRIRLRGQSLACIRCGACLNACPVYQQIGGHAYGSVYPGPIGAVITPQLMGLEKTQQLPYASSVGRVAKFVRLRLIFHDYFCT
jgi:L-lactate dehydrogenase complex protein LldF